ncbi:MAG: LysR substrate-binding domain-containing protein [Xanthomonadales bacterium]
MKLQQLRYLVAIVDNGLNITAASQALFTSQPGVSKQVKILEDELVVATTHTQARYVLPDLLAGFHRQFPTIPISLHQGTSDRIAHQVQNQGADFAIASGQSELFKDLVTFPIYHWERIILVLPDHPLVGKKDVSLKDLALLVDANEEDDEWEGNESAHSSEPRRSKSQTRVKTILADKSREALLDQLLDLAGRYPEVKRQILETEQLLWVIDRVLEDEFCMLDSAETLLQRRAYTRVHWREVAVTLETRLQATPKPRNANFSASYRRERLLNQLLDANGRAGWKMPQVSPGCCRSGYGKWHKLSGGTISLPPTGPRTSLPVPPVPVITNCVRHPKRRNAGRPCAAQSSIISKPASALHPVAKRAKVLAGLCPPPRSNRRRSGNEAAINGSPTSLHSSTSPSWKSALMM